VDQLPPHLPPEAKPIPKPRQDPLVLVATAPSEPLAIKWAGILENEGIRSVVKSRDLRAAMYVPSLLSISDIRVLASQAEKAREVLAPFLESEQSPGHENPLNLE
jgi:hypothetical protein